MVIWEYKSIKLATSGIFGGKVDLERLDAELNELGRQGWEVVTAFGTNMSGGDSREVIVTFKRPMSE